MAVPVMFSIAAAFVFPVHRQAHLHRYMQAPGLAPAPSPQLTWSPSTGRPASNLASAMASERPPSRSTSPT